MKKHKHILFQSYGLVDTSRENWEEDEEETEMKKLGNIGLGNFCKALLEHKNIKIYSDILKLPYIFRWNGERYIDICSIDKTDYTPTEIITLFLDDIYNLKCMWEVIE